MSDMSDAITIEYCFRFEDNVEKNVLLKLDKKNLLLIAETPENPPTWTLLENHKCSNCTLQKETSPYCPIALNLIMISKDFSGHFSYHAADITVKTAERSYHKKTQLQNGLSALIGIIMVTSGCPVMGKLRPMVRFHLPFATLPETFFRMFSMYLFSQYIVKRKGGEPFWEFEGLSSIYAEVGILNRSLTRRLSEGATTDAHLNAVVNLDCFASLIPLSIEDYLKDVEGYFSAYFPAPASSDGT